MGANPKLEGYAIAPALAFDIGSGWEAKIAGVYGSDQTRLDGTFVIAGSDPIVASGQYFNETITLEASAEGPLFDLPGGSARLAMGAGFRDTSLAYDRNDGTISTTFNVKRRARFAFGELYLPLVSPQNDVAGIAELTVTAAVRYEDYPGLDQQATPRIAVRYAPAENITLRASWARSFKAPTLYQQYVFYQAIAVPASFVGAGTGSDTIIAASVSLNYIGALLDRRFESKRRLAPSATLDLAATYTLDQGDGREPSLELSFSIQNLFDQAPRRIEQFGPYDTPYDSTNYSPIGRFISVGIRRHW